MAITVAADARDHGADLGPGLFLRHIDGRDVPVLTNIAEREKNRDRSGTWLRAAMVALGILSATAAVVSYQAQYELIFAFKAVKLVAALQAAIPDCASLVFSCLGIALALQGKRALRARALNVASVATSVAMNLMAAGHGWKALGVWALAPVAYAVTSDTLIGVVRAHTVARQRELNTDVADDENTPLSVLGRFLLWTLRLALAPASTLNGFRTWVIEEAPVAPGRTAMPATAIELLPRPLMAPIMWPPMPAGPVERVGAMPRPKMTQRMARVRPSGPSKTSRFLELVAEKHGPLAQIPLSDVYSISKELSTKIGLDAGSARTALRKAVPAAQAGDD